MDARSVNDFFDDSYWDEDEDGNKNSSLSTQKPTISQETHTQLQNSVESSHVAASQPTVLPQSPFPIPVNTVQIPQPYIPNVSAQRNSYVQSQTLTSPNFFVPQRVALPQSPFPIQLNTAQIPRPLLQTMLPTANTFQSALRIPAQINSGLQWGNQNSNISSTVSSLKILAAVLLGLERQSLLQILLQQLPSSGQSGASNNTQNVSSVQTQTNSDIQRVEISPLSSAQNQALPRPTFFTPPRTFPMPAERKSGIHQPRFSPANLNVQMPASIVDPEQLVYDVDYTLKLTESSGQGSVRKYCFEIIRKDRDVPVAARTLCQTFKKNCERLLEKINGKDDRELYILIEGLMQGISRGNKGKRDNRSVTLQYNFDKQIPSPDFVRSFATELLKHVLKFFRHVHNPEESAGAYFLRQLNLTDEQVSQVASELRSKWQELLTQSTPTTSASASQQTLSSNQSARFFPGTDHASEQDDISQRGNISRVTTKRQNVTPLCSADTASKRQRPGF